MSALLEVEGLRVTIGSTAAVRGASITVNKGETHCLVGESGCGKSISALSVMGLLPRGSRRETTALRFAGQEIGRFSEAEMSRLRGDRMAMIFQEPMTSLNPAYTVGSQMTEVLRRHRGATRVQAVDRAAELLARVGITAPGLRLGQVPHQLSGGLRQRVMIAMALMCDPELLIADEPTTALDVTVQAQILDLLADLRRETGMALVFITHNLGVVAEIAERVVVMYAGQVVEQGETAEVFARPLHPYTRALIAAVPEGDDKPAAIPGVVPPPHALPPGCRFAPRCPYAAAVCDAAVPALDRHDGRLVRCVRVDAVAREGVAA